MKTKNQPILTQVPLRRSYRERTLKKYDYLTISNGRYSEFEIDLFEDVNYFKTFLLSLKLLIQEEYEPKKGRRHRPRKDSEDFDNSQKKHRKKFSSSSRISYLLQWKSAALLPETPVSKFCNIHNVKSIINTDLSKYGSHIEAIFINIEWQNEKSQGINLQKFRNLQIDNNKLMSKGIVFIWSEKQIMCRLMDIMQEKGFVYIQNFHIIYLSAEKGLKQLDKNYIKQNSNKEIKKEVSSSKTISDSIDQDNQIKQEFIQNMNRLGNIEANNLFLQEDGSYFKKSKKMLLMFRKHDNKKDNLQLRHQRTCDVLFDLVTQSNTTSDMKTKNYVYKMIETLLPRSLQNLESNGHLSMMQLWGDKNSPRKGWIILNQK